MSTPYDLAKALTQARLQREGVFGFKPWVDSPDVQPRAGESRSAYMARLQGMGFTWQDFASISQNGDWEGLGNEQYNALFAEGQKDPNGTPGPLGGELDPRWRAFLDEMSKPLDMNSPHVQQIINNASAQGALRAKNVGVEGGLAASNVGYHTGNALAGAQERQWDRYAGLLGNAGQYNMNTARFNEDNYRYDSDRQYGIDMNRAQGPAMAVGAIAGAVPGLAMGSPQMAASGAQTGGMIAGGLAGSQVGYMPRSQYGLSGGYGRGY